MELCPCGSQASYADCCGAIISGTKPAATAEQLMRSRYSAYVKKEMDYIRESLHPEHRGDYDEASSRAWAETAEWQGIKILGTTAGGPQDSEGEVEFLVTFTEKGVRQEHHEISNFKKEKGNWYFTTGKTMQRPVVRVAAKLGRNDPCSCGSGKKYKKCCGK